MSDVTALPMSAWPRSRQVAAAVFVALTVLVLAVGALQAAGMVFLLLSRVDPRQAGWTSILDYWQHYGQEATLRPRLLLASLLPAAAAVLLPVALVIAAQPKRALHGAARFATPAEVARAGLTGARSTTGPSILIGRHRGRFLSLPGQLSVMLSAPTRSGKGVGVVIPNLLNWPHSVVVLDIKGENYDLTAGYRAEFGQQVFAFSPFDENGRSHRWNPLSAVRTSPLHRVGDLLTIGQVFFPNDGSGTSSEAFFNDQARNLFLGLGLLLLETPALPRSIGEMLRQSSGQGQPLKDHLNGVIHRRREQATDRLPALSDECVDALQRLLSNSDNTLSSVVATFHAPLTIFADVVVDAATSGDDFRLQDLRRRRLSIYVRIPPNRLLSARPLLNLFFSQLVSLNTQQLPQQDASLTVQCLLVNDEFTAMGRVPVISTAAAFLAGYHLRLLTVVQAMSQLDAVYGDKEARTFATNHGLQILFAPREQRDADEYSAMLGTFTERATSHGRSRTFSGRSSSSVSRNESEQRRALLLPQEFKELGSERLVVVCEHCKPILGEKIRYHQDPVFQARLRKPPIVPAMDLDLHLAQVQRRIRVLPDELGANETLDVSRLAIDHQALPDCFNGMEETLAHELLSLFDMAITEGGAIEAEPDDDGVLPAAHVDPLLQPADRALQGEMP
ncbi:type IV secretory system conjugative DNA transfer family protein [Aquincola sp. J276]|uniref:type IV secretory system conjugative DNA transfer family protein n=1 Tax=Aquincola sp. J276 TaxID=2898432 RepID=UPI0021517089|nr:type IV secretory system conjugative DNA transfer family protein [Aquincola sp. J276]MCR5868137.1 type IV secretory system conjugative DNA transfer family protein [Aquincola sp. J276]